MCIFDRNKFRSIHTAVISLDKAYSSYKINFELNIDRMKKLWGNNQIILLLEKQINWNLFLKNLNMDAEKFKKERKPFLLYN